MLAFIFVFVSAYEYKISAAAGNTVTHYSTAQYRDSITYQLVTVQIDDSTRYLLINYIMGDSAASGGEHVSAVYNAPDMGVMCSDTSGRVYCAWMDYYNDKSMLFYTHATDTNFAFVPRVLIDSTVYGAGIEWLIFPDIAVSPSGENVFIVYNRYFITDSVVDSVWTEFVYSDDFGNTFAAPQKITTPSVWCFQPDIEASENEVYITYTYLNGPSSEIYLNVIDLPFTVPADELVYPIDTITQNCTEVSSSLMHDTLFVAYQAYNSAQTKNNIRFNFSKVTDLASWTGGWVNSVPRNQAYADINCTPSGRKFITYLDTIPGGGPTAILAEYDTLATNFNSNWVLMVGNGAEILSRQEMNYVDSTHMYIYLPVNNAGMKVVYQASAKPDKAPPAPENIMVNDTTEALWYDNSNFTVKWTEPYDLSGIYKAYVRYDNPPASNNDTTFTTEDTLFYRILAAEGSRKAFVWLMDYRGNMDYHNNATVEMKFDSSAPIAPVKIDPLDKDTVYTRDIKFAWRTSTDAVSGIDGYGLLLDTLLSMATAKLYLTTDTSFSFDTTDIAEPFMDRRYFWNVLAGDSAGNIANGPSFFMDLRATNPVQLISPANGDSVNLPFSIIWNKINGFDDNIVGYRVHVSNDSLFSTFEYNQLTSNNNFDVTSTNADSVYVRVRGINAAGTECRWSEIRKVYIKDNIYPSDTLDISLSALPDTVLRGGGPVIVKLQSNVDSITFSESYYHTDSGGNVNITFTVDSLDSKVFNYEFINTGIADSLVMFYVKCSDKYGFADSAFVDVMIYDTLSMTLTADPSQVFSGDSIVLNLNVNTPLLNILESYFYTQSQSQSNISFTQDLLDPLHYYSEMSTNNIHDAFIHFFVKCENAAHSIDSSSISVRVLDSLHITLDLEPDTVQIGEDAFVTLWSNYDSITFLDAYYYWGENDTVHMSMNEDSVNSRRYNYYLPTAGMDDSEVGIFIKCANSELQEDSAYKMLYVLFPDRWVDEDNVLPWPNPATGNEIYLRMKLNNNADVDIKLFDIKGGFVNLTEDNLLSGQSKDILIDIGNLKPDLYFMIINITNTDTGETMTIKRKFVKAS